MTDKPMAYIHAPGTAREQAAAPNDLLRELLAAPAKPLRTAPAVAVATPSAVPARPARRLRRYVWESLIPLPRTSGQLTAYALWFIAAFTTGRLFSELGAILPVAVALGLMIQGIATKLESPWWSGRKNALSAGVVVLDTLVNAGGLWQWIKQLGATSLWQMLVDVSGLQGGMKAMPAFILALILGYILAAAPEKVWQW